MTRGKFVLGLLASIPILAVGVAWALASPVGSSPDDDFHLASIWCSEGVVDGRCHEIVGASEDSPFLVRVPATVGPGTVCFAFRSDDSAACQAGLSDDDSAWSRANDGEYPGLYYRAAGFLVGESGVRSVLFIRIASWAASMLLLAATAVSLSGRERAGFLLAVSVTLVPLGVFLLASTNPSGIAIAATPSAGVAFRSWYTGRATRPAVAYGTALTAAAVGAGARADVGVFVVVAVFAVMAIESSSGSSGWRRRGQSLLLLGTATLPLLLAGQARSGATGLQAPIDRSLGDTFWYNLTHLPSLWTGSFGTWGLGWLDTRMPDVVWVAGLIAAVAVIARGSLRWRRSTVTLGVMLGGFLITYPMYMLLAGGSIVGENFQPRYLLPMIVLFVAVLLSDIYHRGVRRGLAVGLVALMSVGHSVALHANMRRYITGQDVRSFSLNHGIEWWWGQPTSPMTWWLIGSVAFAVSLLVVQRFALNGLRSAA